MSTAYRKKKRVVIKPRFYLFLAFFVALIAWIVIAIVRYFAPPVVEWGKLSTDQEVTAVIIRDERVIYASAYGKFENVAAEGEYVEQEAEIALLYQTDFSEDEYDSLVDVRQEIKNYQEENILKNVVHKEIVDLDYEIEELINEISALVMSGKTRVLPAKERMLAEVMEEKRLYMNDTLHKDATLEAKFLREEVMVENIESAITRLYAPAPGIISFYIDGLEEVLTQERVESINIDDYQLIEEEILNATVKSNINEGSVVTAEQPIYRIIQPNHWFAVIKVPRSKNTLVKGGTCDITFENYGHTLSNIFVYDVRHYGKEALVVLEFSSDIGPMSSLRIVTGNLGRSNEGYKIPIEYLTQQGPQSGVNIINQDKTITFIPVNVIAQNYMEAIVEPTADSQVMLEEGQKLKKP